MIVLATASMSGATEMHLALQQRLQEIRDRSAAIVRKGIEDGSIRHGIDPQAAAAVREALTRGIVLQFLVDEEFFDLARARKAAREAMDAWLTRPT
jgi:hypothetical protein